MKLTFQNNKNIELNKREDDRSAFLKRRNQGNHKEDKFRECKNLWYELRENPKPQTRPLIRTIV